ncbi:MAG: tRNA (adenosine(37)-N6)-threonylcarbamoyltransferase complex dimerization subunit type 1 TsaB [Bdellovibrionaceae bacterium]|nr:tRNA (adenosine(37)-N6)-threonylcarbamoyltransferase complex dimerization subunit type 1 TsaB [Pseudobdellovibrionaceae bacterium]MBX3033734.1 tRNA (adenosine(37)-N6)-threonylcarbamoyltransferase complex dimerization subunit type 1 TsaB [Pseudobdellovibrionaceae bacterium]
MKILALETSTQRGGAALVIDGRVVAEETTDRQRSHSELLHPFIEKCLSRASLRLEDVDLFAVGQGPGSFTGIRVAANAGKSFSFIYDKPLVTVDSLTQIAAQVRDRSRPVLAMLNAFKNMVYYGLFDVSGDEPRPLSGPGVCPVRELDPLIQTKVTVAGDGYGVYLADFSDHLKGLLHREDPPADFPTPGTLGRLAAERARQGRVLRWNDFVPLYLRASEAEENKRGALFNSTDMKDPVHGKTRS